MKRPAADRIRDALGAMDAAEAFVSGLTREAFAADMRTVFAVERCFTILGEALSHVPDSVRAAYPDVPWQDVRGMRNRITHDYLRTDKEMMWQTIHSDFPALRPLLDRVLAAL